MGWLLKLFHRKPEWDIHEYVAMTWISKFPYPYYAFLVYAGLIHDEEYEKDWELTNG